MSAGISHLRLRGIRVSGGFLIYGNVWSIMPNSPLRPCTYPGCPRLVAHGRCEVHAVEPRISYHNPEHQKLYGDAWKKRRLYQLAAHPWCELCLQRGIYVPATDVHHIQPHKGNKVTFITSPLQSLCHACHSSLTASEGRG